jgi:hypothetical protein
VSLSLSFSLDDLKVGPQKLRLLFSLTGSAMGVTCIDVIDVIDLMVCVLIVKVKLKRTDATG